MNTSIYSLFLSLNKNHNEHYLKRYIKLVSFFKERNWSYKSGLHHEHHIVPESFGGEDSKENLVFITIREHFILHWMLYKAFPNSGMVIAFNMMCNCWGKDFRITSKVYEKLQIENVERVSKTQKKLVAEGNHPFLGGELVRKLIAEGNHPFCGGEMQRQTQNRRVKEGTNPFCNGEMSRQNNKKMFESGTHSFQIKIECEHCKKIVHKGNYIQWHGDKCKLNPLYKKEIKEKFECPHCHRYFSKSNFTRYHNDNCKLNPLYKNEMKPKIKHKPHKKHKPHPKVECPHCKGTFSKTNFIRWHGNNCKLKP